jgi:hypothetical protein
MSDYWNDASRQRAITTALSSGYCVIRQTRKCIGVAVSEVDVPLYVSTQGDVDSFGSARSIRVVMHPKRHSKVYLDTIGGVAPAVNPRGRGNLFGNSNYRGLPIVEGTEVPGGPALDCADFGAFERLLATLRSRSG